MSFSDITSWIFILVAAAVSIGAGVWFWFDNDMPAVWNEMLKANNR